MNCPSLSVLQAPGQLTRTMRALRHIRRPVAFAFQAHNPSISYAGIDAVSPPVLLLAAPGRSIHAGVLRALRIPAPEDEPFRSGRLIRGWVFAEAGMRVFATPQAIAPRVVRRGLACLARLAGSPSIAAHLRICTGRQGAALIGSYEALRALRLQRKPTRFALCSGTRPSLSLHRYAFGDLIGLVARRQGRLCFTLTNRSNETPALRSALNRLNRLCGRPLKRAPRLLWRPAAAVQIQPLPGTKERLKRLYTHQKSVFLLPMKENQMIQRHGSGSIYGELKLSGLSRIFERIPTLGMTFLDMGSGNGAVVLAAALGFPLRRCDGVELSPTRAAIASRALASLRRQTGRRWSHVHLYEANMLTLNIRRYDIIFLSNLCFGTDFNKQLGKKFDREIRTRTHVLSSRVIPSRRSTTMPMVNEVEMSWNQSSQLHHAIWDG